MRWKVAILLLFLSFPFSLARGGRGGGRRGGGRGRSGARSRSSAARIPGVSQGSFRNSRTGATVFSSSSYRMKPHRMAYARGLGSTLSVSTSFIAGMSIIRVGGARYSYGGRYYYWDRATKENLNYCNMTIDEMKEEMMDENNLSFVQNESLGNDNITQVFSTIQYENGTRPKQIVWGCDVYDEVCCGLACCEREPNYDLLGCLLIIGFLLFVICLSVKGRQDAAYASTPLRSY